MRSNKDYYAELPFDYETLVERKMDEINAMWEEEEDISDNVIVHLLDDTIIKERLTA